jgi:hypothetical protein
MSGNIRGGSIDAILPLVATDDVAGVQFQRVKLDVGADGASDPVVGTLPVSVASLPLPSGAATATLQTQPGVDIGDVTVNNGAGAAAVNIQDGGNAITVDGAVTVSGSVTGADAGTTAHDAPGAAVSPLAIGGYASAAAPTDVSADADIVRAWMLRNGATSVVLTAAGALIPGDATNGLDVDVTRLPALVTGSAAIGKLAANSGVDIGDVDVTSIAAGDNNIGNVDIASVPADPFGANADAASATGSISAKLRFIAATGIPVTSLPAVDTELMAAAALADAAAANPTTPSVGAVGLLMNATTLDRQRAIIAALDSAGTGIAAAGLVGQLDDASTAGVTENQFAPVRISTRRALLVEGVASGTAVPISAASLPSHAVTNAGTFAVQVVNTNTMGVVDETGTSAVDAAAVGGGTPHDSVDSGNPLLTGARALAHGTNPTAVAAADRTVVYANRAGIPWVIGGHPNVQTVKHTTITTAVTDAKIITVAGGLKIVVTAFTVTLDNASTVFPTFLMGFAQTNTPTTTQVIGAHGGIPAGGGFSRGDGSGILGIGADGDDLIVTTTGNATGNGLQIVVTYYTIES